VPSDFRKFCLRGMVAVPLVNMRMPYISVMGKI
jgi:hypothetical protein